jgi:hypothetical protein
MKKLMTLIFTAMFLVACGGNDTSAPDTVTPEKNTRSQQFETPSVTSQKNAESIPTGGICGGPEKLTCERANICIFDSSDSEGKGRCDALVVNEGKECPDTQEPVCGLRKGQKHGFLNACYAEKHGAEVVAEGLCKTVDVSGQCEATALGVGTCFSTVEAYEFDGTTCQKKYITGCKAEVPFETLAACEDRCQ